MTSPLSVTDRPSPNCDERDAPIDMIILHYTGMKTGDEAIKRLCDPAARVSAHYVVEEDGAIYRLVDEEKRAWHAGVSSWMGEVNINARSIGVEIVNPGHEWGYRAFSDSQIASVAALLKDIVERRKTSLTRIVGHSDIAPRRKEDPGELFPWALLASEGVAIAPYTGDPDPTIPYEIALAALTDIGYDAPPGDHAAALLAFQRRFAPSSLGQGFDGFTKAALIWAKAAMAG